jgi:hypothetical protein
MWGGMEASWLVRIKKVKKDVVRVMTRGGLACDDAFLAHTPSLYAEMRM